MPLVSYSDFDKLRLREFAATDPGYYEDEEEHGTAFLEQLRGVSFARARSRPEQLHTVDVEFRYASPEIARATLQRLGLGISPFMSQSVVKQHFGAPVEQATWPPDYRVAWFEIGDADRYRVRCGFGNDDRLDCLVFSRLDFPMDVSEFA
jgi:hypothetical protein